MSANFGGIEFWSKNESRFGVVSWIRSFPFASIGVHSRATELSVFAAALFGVSPRGPGTIESTCSDY
jgi:hypothetical protein